ncbi:MAG TPA: MFS transporter, partial [Candidatus Binataceae bacterium]|nr:MFS transporter [Candidatus Binataceae bacterium]
VVIVNWFKGRGGFFGGVVSFGFGVGMTLTPPLLTLAIARLGWRPTLRWMAVPALLLMLPAAVMVVRTRPPRTASPARPAAGDADYLSGFEPAAGLRTSAFWLIVLTQFLGTLGFSAVFVHTITYLIGVGYTPQHAALIFSSQTLVSCPGVVIMGWLGDRYRPQPVLAICALLMGGAMLALLGAANARLAPAMIPLFALCWGAGAGTNNTVLTVLLAQAMGLRRLGTMIGIKYFVAAISMSLGPVLSGRLYDLSGSYTRPFELAALLMVGSAIAVSMVRIPDLPALSAPARVAEA